MSIFHTINALPIMDVAARLGIETKRAGKECAALCFAHNEKTPSMFFNEHKNVFKCHGCDAGGSCFDLVLQHQFGGNANDKAAMQATVNWFKREYNLTDDRSDWKPSRRPTPRPENRATPPAAPVDRTRFTAIYQAFIDSLPPVTADCYLTTERKLSKAVLDAANVRQIPPGYDYRPTLKGFTVQELHDSGMTADSKNGKRYFTFFAGEFVFPFYCPAGNIISLQTVTRPNTDGKRAKMYLANNNEKTPKPFLYLPPQFATYKPGANVYITEGVIDALSLLTMDINAVAIPDANGSASALSEVDALAPFTVHCAGDVDRAGYLAMRRIKDYFQEHHNKPIEIWDIQDWARKGDLPGAEKIKDANEFLRALIAKGAHHDGE